MTGPTHKVDNHLLSNTGLSPSVVSVSTELLLAFTYQRAGPLSLAATQGVEFLSFPMGTEMFQFPTFAPHDYVFIMR